MTRSCHTLLLQLCLVAGFIGCCAARGSEPTVSPGHADEVKTRVQSIRTSSLEPLREITMTRGTNELWLVAPQELGIDTSSPAKVILAPRDLAYWVSVAIIPPESGSAGSDVARPGSNWVVARFSGAQVTEEGSIPTGEGDCRVFNFTCPVRGVRAPDRVGRVGLIRTPVGMVELVMVASPERAKTASDDFHAVLRSFQTNQRGPIKRIVMPDHS